jgi:hypothetical protein
MNCASWSSGKLGELFKVKRYVSKVRLAAVATLTMGGCTQFFAGWIRRFGNPTIFFIFPLSERAPGPLIPTTTK